MKFGWLILFMLLAVKVFSNDPIRTGVILDANSGESLSGVAIFVDGKLACYSDELGNFQLPDATHAQTIEFRLVSFETMTLDPQSLYQSACIVQLKEL